MNQPHPHDAASAPLCPIPRDGLPKLSAVLLSALLTISSAMVGVGLLTAGTPLVEAGALRYVSIGVLFLLAFFLWRFTRSAKGLIPALIFVGFLVYYLTSSPALTAALVSLLFAIGEGSFLLAVLPRKQLALFPVIPILAYAAALVLTRDPFAAAAALVPFPPMIALALGTRSSAERENGPTRVGVICATSLALGLSLLAVTALLLYHTLGTLSPDALAVELENLREALIVDITSAEIPEGLDPELVAELEQLLTRSGAENMVNSVFNLLPAIFVVVANVLAAVAQMALHATLRTFRMESSLTPRVRAFHMSLISCLVFFAAYLVAFFENANSSTLTGTVAQNIYIILMPGLALAGMIRVTTALTRKGPRGMGCLFFLVFLIPCLFIFAPFVLAAFEVIGHIFSSITSAIKPDDDSSDQPPFGKD